MKKIFFTYILTIIFAWSAAASGVWAQTGEAPSQGSAVPPETTTGTSASQPSTVIAQPRETPPSDAVVPAPNPATVIATPTPTETPVLGTPTPTPEATVQPLPLVQAGVNTEQSSSEQENSFGIWLLIVAAGVIGLGGFAVYAIQANTRKPKNKSQENEEEKTNCLDLKERMEKKLAELTDLRAQAGGKAQAYARKKVTGTVAASAAGEVLIKIQKAEQEYNRLKFLLEECWAGARARKRVFIIHQWSGTSKDGWYPWLRQKLETENYTVEILNMPDTNAPTIEAWVQYLAQRVGVVSEKTFFVGHSIGVQTILRYLETLPAEVRVGGVIGVAGWFRLAREDKKIARPWLETPIDFFRVKQHCDNFFMIFSDNDTYVPISNQKLFEQHIGAATLVLHDRGHFTQADKIFTLPEALDWFIKK